jgi:hypothetical protein
MTSSNLLYRVTAKAKPTPAHPQFFDWQYGLVEVWIYATSIDEAGVKTRAILDLLPYEVVGPNMRIQLDKPSLPSDPPGFDTARSQATFVGFGLCLCVVPVGTDEQDFESLSFS